MEGDLNMINRYQIYHWVVGQSIAICRPIAKTDRFDVILVITRYGQLDTVIKIYFNLVNIIKDQTTSSVDIQQASQQKVT